MTTDAPAPEVPRSGRERWKLIWRQGSEFAPDAPNGLDVLKLRLDGALSYENRKAGKRRACTAQVSQDQVQAWIDAVRESGFPEVPDPQVAPGADLAALELIGPFGANQVHFRLSKASAWPGYAWMSATAGQWAEHLRGPAPSGTSAPDGILEIFPTG